MQPSLYSVVLAPPCQVNVANYNPPPPPPPAPPPAPPPPPSIVTPANMIPSITTPRNGSIPAMSQGNHLRRLQLQNCNSNAPSPRRLRHHSLLKSTSSLPS